jgi:hypothetical protein
MEEPMTLFNTDREKQSTHMIDWTVRFTRRSTIMPLLLVAAGRFGVWLIPGGNDSD